MWAGFTGCLLLVYLVRALVPSDTACLASSAGSRWWPKGCAASEARRSNVSLTTEFVMLMALEEMARLGCTCQKVKNTSVSNSHIIALQGVEPHSPSQQGTCSTLTPKRPVAATLRVSSHFKCRIGSHNATDL